MFRKGIATLLVCATSAASVSAQNNDSGQQTPPDSLKSNPRQTASATVQPAPGLQAAAAPLNPLPIQMAPVIPNTYGVSRPQYFSAANGRGIAQPVYPGRNWQQYQPPQPVQRTSSGYFHPVSGSASQPPMNRPASSSPSGAPLAPGTALYPAPRPGIPHQVGATAISNQFLNPHEMLYAHEYKAMYPPYSYKVNGKWMVTPFGVWSHEDWHLQGTMVDVKYKSSISPFALFTTPVRR